LELNISRGKEKTVIGIVGDVKNVDQSVFNNMEGVDKILKVSVLYKLVSREFCRLDTIITIGSVKIGGNNFTSIAGPCAIESLAQMRRTAKFLQNNGVKIMRGGAFKPRTSPYAFKGLGVQGLEIMRDTAHECDLLTVSEVMKISQIDIMMEYVDILQIGARNMKNFSLLEEVGKIDKPVLLKRGESATVEDLLLAAEHIAYGGNKNIILCERGIKTFANYTRNTLDLSVVPILHKLTHLPVIVDPSHATGIRELVLPMALAATAAGAQGLMIEIHPKPEEAKCDGVQSLTFKQFKKLKDSVETIWAAAQQK